MVTGLGEFIARDAAQAAGLDVVSLADDLGVDAARVCARGGGGAAAVLTPWRGPCQVRPRRHVDFVIKVGGGLLEHVEHLDRVLAAIAEVARTQRVVVVPGGGPFADAVRDADGRLGLGDDAAHWMAILGMDQYAHLLASRLSGAVVVSTSQEIDSGLRQRQIPVLAPSRWLSSIDPLPHTWDVTSDSIAAWVAGELGAARLLLVKPPGASGADLVDAYFERTLPPSVAHDCLAADEAIQLLTQIAGIVNPAFETT